jgi:putative restriction endonuclease
MAAFEFLADRRRLFADPQPRAVLSAGFEFEGKRVPLLGPQGIFKPAVMELPLSVTTVPQVHGRPRPYEDEVGEGGVFTYRYRGEDPKHRDNVGLRRLQEQATPLVYFWGTRPGWYEPFFPSFIVAEDFNRRAFTVQVSLADDLAWTATEQTVSRQYATRLVQQRLHQSEFRLNVITAYRTTCAVCSLKGHPELLDASHILRDKHVAGVPTVPNGLALCKIHHSAYDASLIGIRPDYVVEVRKSLMDEVDGPMLLHGLQGIRGRTIVLPHKPQERPDPEFLEERFEEFRQAG